MFDFFKQKKKPPVFKVEIRAYENGEKVILEDKPIGKEHKTVEQYCRIRDTVQPYEDIIIGFAQTLKEKLPIDDEIEVTTALIDAYNDFKDKCCTLGGDYFEYFYESWETSREGKPDGPSYVSRYETKLEYLKSNYDQLKAKEEIKSQILPNLDQSLMAYIKTNQPILQTDIYKQFDESVKDDIKEILYFAEKSNQIKREKCGRTYLVSLK